MQRLSRISRYLENSSGNLSKVFFVAGLFSAYNVGVALYQGVGLHGYIIATTNNGNHPILPVWGFFVFSLLAFSMSAAFGLVR